MLLLNMNMVEILLHMNMVVNGQAGKHGVALSWEWNDHLEGKWFSLIPEWIVSGVEGITACPSLHHFNKQKWS